MYRRLVGKKIAAVDGVVKMLPGGIAFAFQILCSIDAALSADRVRTLDRHYGEKIARTAHLGDLYYRGKTCQAAAYDDHSGSCHYFPYGIPHVAASQRYRAAMASVGLTTVSVGSRGQARSERRVTMPTTMNSAPMAKQT